MDADYTELLIELKSELRAMKEQQAKDAAEQTAMQREGIALIGDVLARGACGENISLLDALILDFDEFRNGAKDEKEYPPVDEAFTRSQADD